MNDKHECPEMKKAIEDGYDDDLMWGGAISNIYRRDNGRWMAENGEYGVYINFCPFCGKRLK